MPKTCHLRLKLNIMAPTNLYAVKKFEQNEQNDNAVPMRQVQKKKKTWTLPISQKHLLVPNSQTHLPKFQNEICGKQCIKHTT